MSEKPPYMTSPGNVKKILDKAIQAKKPDKFTIDFLDKTLDCRGGSSTPIIPLLKKLGFLGADGVPTLRYSQFRNASSRGQAMAEGMREAYFSLFEKKEIANELSREDITQLVTEITGAGHDDRTVKLAVSTFEALKEYAGFDPDTPTHKTFTKANPVTADFSHIENHAPREIAPKILQFDLILAII
jgi:hypothetical protein